MRARVYSADLAGGVDAEEALVIRGEDDAGSRMERDRVMATHFIAPDDALTPPLLAIDYPRCARGDWGVGIFDADRRLIGILVEFVDASLFASSDGELQTTAGSGTTTVRSQNDPKLSPG